MENAKNKREVKGSNSVRVRHRFHGNLGEDLVERSSFSAEDFVELSVRRNLEKMVVGWEHGLSFLGLNCGSLEIELARFPNSHKASSKRET
ncbi:hypothetical protein ACFX1T_021350 [Malus domestica]